MGQEKFTCFLDPFKVLLQEERMDPNTIQSHFISLKNNAKASLRLKTFWDVQKWIDESKI